MSQIPTQSSSVRRLMPPVTERVVLRAILYVIAAVSGAIALIQAFVIVTPRKWPIQPHSEEFNTLLDFLQHRFNQSTMIILFAVAVSALAVSSRPDHREP